MDGVVPILVLAITATMWLLFKLLVIFLHVKYRLKLSCQLAWSGHLKNIEIVRLASLNGDNDKKALHVRIDKLWVSSSLFDRAVDMRLAICFNNVTVECASSVGDETDVDLSVSSLLAVEKLAHNKLLVWVYVHLRRFVLLFLSYFGSLMINQLKFSVDNKLISFRIDKFKGLIFFFFFSKRLSNLHSGPDLIFQFKNL
jgi:hypothetical protein